MGSIFGYILGYLRIHHAFFAAVPQIDLDPSWIRQFFPHNPDPVFLSDLAAFEGVLIGVAIPISLQVVTWAAERYRDHEIAQFFTNERLYRLQYFLLLPNIALAIFLRFLNITNLLWLWFAFFWLLANICVFYKFIKLVEQYSTNIDKLLLRKLKENVEAILKK